jgi:endonuclease G
MLKKTLLFLFLLINFIFLSQELKFEIPFFQTEDTIISHFAYSVSYNTKHRQANWVAYQLTKSELVKVVERKDKFIADPLIPNTDNEKDYKNSGFDRGHLAPAGDMLFSSIAMKESFYFSNMSPQNPSFNRGIWKKLEEKVRTWAENFDSLYIVTGPILHDSLCEIGFNGLKVPHHYYKVIVDMKKKQGIAFLIPNESTKLELTNFILSIFQLEQIIGINFFPSLSSEEVELVEKQYCFTCWEKK